MSKDWIVSTRCGSDRVATDQPTYLECDTPAGALDRLDEHTDSDGYAVSPCDLCLDDLELVREAGPEWDW